MDPRLIDMRRIPCDLCVFALGAYILQVEELGTGRPHMILKLPQSREFRIPTKCLEHMVAEMPGLAGTVPRQIYIEVVFFEPLYRSPE